MGSEQQLRSTSDEVLDTLDKLHQLEVEKRSIPPTDPRFHELAKEVQQLADGLTSTAEVQAALGEKVAEKHDLAGNEAPAIDETPRDVMTILADWRDAERRRLARLRARPRKRRPGPMSTGCALSTSAPTSWPANGSQTRGDGAAVPCRAGGAA